MRLKHLWGILNNSIDKKSFVYDLNIFLIQLLAHLNRRLMRAYPLPLVRSLTFNLSISFFAMESLDQFNPNLLQRLREIKLQGKRDDLKTVKIYGVHVYGGCFFFSGTTAPKILISQKI